MPLPTNLANGDLITEGWVDSVTNSIAALDNATSATFLAALDSRYMPVAGGPRRGGTWRRVATQTVLNATNATIVWDTEDADTGAALAIPSDTYTVPVGEAGLYDITSRIMWGANPVAGFIQIQCSAAGSFIGFVGNSLSLGGYVSVSSVPLAASETVKIGVYQTNGAAVTAVGRLDIYRRDP